MSDGDPLVRRFEECVRMWERACGRAATVDDLVKLGVHNVASAYLGRELGQVELRDFAVQWLEIRKVIDS